MAPGRLLQAGLVTVIALALANAPVYAASKKPEIFQVSPTKVNPTTQPNIMILGQYLTPTSTVEVGGRPATTVQAPDPNHLLVKLPDNLSQGSYEVQVTNEAGSAVATDALVVDGAAAQLSTLQYAAGGGVLLFLVLVMRLARTPGLS